VERLVAYLKRGWRLLSLQEFLDSVELRDVVRISESEVCGFTDDGQYICVNKLSKSIIIPLISGGSYYEVDCAHSRAYRRHARIGGEGTGEEQVTPSTGG